MTTFIILTVALALVVLIMKEYGWSDLTGNTRNDLVFEQRNKSYGAYEIRQKYSSRLIVAFFGMLGIMTMAAFAPKYLMKNNQIISCTLPVPKPEIKITEVTQEKEKEVIEEPKENLQEQGAQQKKNDISTFNNTNPIANDKLQERDTTKKDDNAVASNQNHTSTDTSSTAGLPPSTTGCTDCPPTRGPGNGGGDGNSETPISPNGFMQKPAKFNGNIADFLRKNIKYPDLAVEANITGKVYVEFIVSENGSVRVSKIKKSAHPLLDNEAKRVINLMQNWEPAENEGKKVKVVIVQPITFTLDSN